MTIRAWLLSLCILLAVGVIGGAIALIVAVNRVKVGGPLYLQLIQNKELVSDSVSPAVNLLEPYLLALQCVDDNNGNSRAERLDRLLKFMIVYAERQQYWKATLPESELKTMLCENSHAPAEQFLSIIQKSFIPASQKNDRMGMRKVVNGDLLSAFTVHEQAIAQLITLSEAEQHRVESAAEDGMQQSFFILGIIGLVIVVVCGLVLLRTGSRINRGFFLSVTTLKKLAAGDLTHRLSTKGGDEFAQIGQAINHMADELTKLVAVVRQQASDLQRQGDQLTSTAEIIVGAAGNTSSRADAANQASVRMVTTMNTVAGAAGSLNQASREITISLQGSVGAVSQAAMLAKRANESIATLSQASEGISLVVSEIAAIAAQTNLLALNAAIEAASAGAAGRGFAVVAQEVKILARKTAEATNVISKRVADIQAATKQTKSQMGEVATSVEQLQDNHHSIAAAVEEQSQATALMSEDLRRMNVEGEGISTAMSEANSAASTAHESASAVQVAASELRQAAQSLTHTVADKQLPI